MSWARKKASRIKAEDSDLQNYQFLMKENCVDLIKMSHAEEIKKGSSASDLAMIEPIEAPQSYQNTNTRHENTAKSKLNQLEINDTYNQKRGPSAIPHFAKNKLKKANSFVLDEFLDKSRQILEALPRSNRYISSLDEVGLNEETRCSKSSESQLLLLLSKTSCLDLAEASSSFVAIDCEMVGVGPKGSSSVLGRVSIVDYYGNTAYDSFVFQNDVTDYRTWVSGISAKDLKMHHPLVKFKRMSS